MSITVGRAGLDATAGVLRWSKARWDGDELDLSGWIRDAASVAEMRAVRDQIRGLVNDVDFPVVPVVFSEDPTLDGFFRVTGATVDSTPTMRSGVRSMPFDVSLRRVRSAGQPVHESRCLHVLRSGSAVTSASADPLLGVPPDTAVYQRGSTGLGSLSGRDVASPASPLSAGSVLVDVWAGSDTAQQSASWQAPPATFLEGGCLVTQSIGSGAYRALNGRQVPADVSPNADWALGNGLVVVLPGQAVGGSAGTIGVLSWAGAAYESLATISMALGGLSISTFSSVTILRNSPEACSIRLGFVTTTPYTYGTLDLTVRRGDRMVQGVIRTTIGGVIDVQVAGAATAITGGARLTSNDADGNRWVLCSAIDVPDVSSGTYAGLQVNPATLLDFGFGVEIGGSGASGIDTAQSLANQYAAAVSEQVSTVNP